MMRDADRFGYGHRIRLVGEGPDVSPRQELPGKHLCVLSSAADLRLMPEDPLLIPMRTECVLPLK